MFCGIELREKINVGFGSRLVQGGRAEEAEMYDAFRLQLRRVLPKFGDDLVAVHAMSVDEALGLR